MSTEFSNNPNNPYATPETDFNDELSDYHTEPFYSRHGRIGRLRYMAYNFILTVLVYIAVIPILLLIGFLGGFSEDGNSFILILAMIVFFPILCYAAFVPAIRRLNDLNRSGWLCLLMMVPYLNILFGLYLMFAPGDEGYNDYGAPAMPPSTRVKIAALGIPALVFIMGILAAIALPAYQDYVMRSKIAEEQYRMQMQEFMEAQEATQ